MLQVSIESTTAGVTTTVNRTFQLITAGTVLTPGSGEGILFVPGEPSEVLAQRIALAIEASLADAAPRTQVLFEIGQSKIDLVSVDDEDGVPVADSFAIPADTRKNLEVRADGYAWSIPLTMAAGEVRVFVIQIPKPTTSPGSLPE